MIVSVRNPRMGPQHQSQRQLLQPYDPLAAAGRQQLVEVVVVVGRLLVWPRLPEVVVVGYLPIGSVSVATQR